MLSKLWPFSGITRRLDLVLRQQGTIIRNQEILMSTERKLQAILDSIAAHINAIANDIQAQSANVKAANDATADDADNKALLQAAADQADAIDQRLAALQSALEGNSAPPAPPANQPQPETPPADLTQKPNDGSGGDGKSQGDAA